MLEFPAVGQQWRTENSWLTLSRYRPDGWREGIKLWRLPGVSSTPGLWHSIDVSFASATGDTTLSVSVDGFPLDPLSDGQRLADGGTVSLAPLLQHGGWIGLLGSNGQGAFAKPQFRKLTLQASQPPLSVRGTPTWNSSTAPANPSEVWKAPDGCCGTLVRCPSGQVVTIHRDHLGLSTDQGKSFAFSPAPHGWSGGDDNTSASCTLRCAAGDVLECYRLTGKGPAHGGGEHTMIRSSTASGGPAQWKTWSPPTVVHRLSFPAEAWGLEPGFDKNLSGLSGPMSMLELPPKQAGGNGTLVTFAYTAQCFPEPCAQQNSAGFTSAPLLTRLSPLCRLSRKALTTTVLSAVNKPDLGGINLAFASTDSGGSWTISRLDSNPQWAVDHAPMDRKAPGSEISAAPTKSGGVLAFVRPNFSPWMWTTRTPVAGMGSQSAAEPVPGVTWEPLSRGAFP